MVGLFIFVAAIYLNIACTEASPEYGFQASGRLRSSADRPLFTPWINLDRSIGRRERMQGMFDTIQRNHRGALDPVRLSAVDAAKVEQLVASGRLTTVGTTLLNKFADNTHNWQHHFRGEYLKTEAGCTLSHLFAIKRAYDRGEDIALVVEDDSIISDKFLFNWKRYVSLAPRDWQVIQLYSNSHAVMKLTSRIEGDGFLPWMPDHYGTAAYLINRAGMKALLDISYSESTGWTLPEKMVVADEFLYFYTTAYTALDPMVYIIGSNSTIQKDSSDELTNRVHMSEQAFMAKLGKPFLQHPEAGRTAPRILIITTTKINYLNETQSAVDLFFSNVGIISRHAKIRYELLILLRQDDFKQHVIDAIKPYLLTYGDRTNIHFKTQINRFNKFRFVKLHISDMSRYDYVLLIDSDILFSGYPWAEFFQRQREAKAVVTGSVRESKSEGLIRNLHPGVRQWFKVFDGSWWKHPLNQDVNFVYTDFLEQYFALIDGAFAQWYFAQVLTYEILHLDNGEPTESDFGPDVMWCGSAAQWLSTLAANKGRYAHPCALVPLVISHADTRQIAYSGGEMDKSHLRKQVSLFPQWTNYSYKFRNVLGGKRWNSVNMSTILYEYSGYGKKELASMGMKMRRKSSRVVVKKKVARKKTNSSKTKTPPEEQQEQRRVVAVRSYGRKRADAML